MEKPILFNTEMVKAILEGRKTTTRRIIKSHRKATIENAWIDKKDNKLVAVYDDNSHIGEKGYIKIPYKVGDILYVRETWNTNPVQEYLDAKANKFVYKATDENFTGGWKPSIHMPKSAARIFLKVTDVKVERLQDMTRTKAIKEGFKDDNALNNSGELLTSLGNFARLWGTTIKKDQLNLYGWDANPWVWVIEFERIEK
ncbi:hypothetical protein [Clostridium sp. HBUAS56017]|uniref:hypothetical protein n=1 Tax=Clostridium sp. HBUAS56017 TaxID=2571128 RepID=UPI00117789BB|nr:hypothetical protein [Clostridium sp. HBUAS56017]